MSIHIFFWTIISYGIAIILFSFCLALFCIVFEGSLDLISYTTNYIWKKLKNEKE